MTEKTILLVDDEERLLNSISKRISLLGFNALKASSGLEAIELVKAIHIDMAIVDLKLSDMEGLITITKLKEIIPELKTVLLTGYGNEKVRKATEALGSVYVEKDSMGDLWDIVKQSCSQDNADGIRSPSASRAGRPNRDTSGSPAPGGNAPEKLQKIIGESPEIQRLKKNIKRFAEMDCAIVLKGESGTGKELAARTIHRLSRRSRQRFLAFDCGCFSNDFNFRELILSMGDTAAPGGRVPPLTDNRPLSFSGTVFLDHVESMPRQSRQEMVDLLDGRQMPDQPPMDVRFILVQDQRRRQERDSGNFLRKLYSRLHAIEIEIPPLRERLMDLPVLVKYFLDQSSREMEKRITTISNDAFRALQSYTFPGNIRELKQIIERAVIHTGTDAITIDHLPDRLGLSPGTVSEKTAPKAGTAADSTRFPTIQEMEKQHILNALEITRGNKSKAAEVLGISRAALWRKLRSYKK